MATWYMAKQNIAAAHIQQETQLPLNEVIRTNRKFPYRPNIVSGLYFYLSCRDRASGSRVGMSLAGLPKAGKEVRSPDRAKGNGRASIQDGSRPTTKIGKVGARGARVESEVPLCIFVWPGGRRKLHPMQNKHSRVCSIDCYEPCGCVPDALADAKADFPSIRLSK
jgi:hypothetical protein